MPLPSWNTIQPNIKSGITVSLIAIPLSISLAVASGGTPLQGLITAIWACIIAAFIWGSNYNVFGPAGALTALLLAFYSNTQDVYTLPILAIFTGIWAWIIRLLKLTKYITLIPSTVLHGFIAGVSLIIAFWQLPNIVGIYTTSQHTNIIHSTIQLLQQRANIKPISVILFIWGLLFLIIRKKYIKSFPGPIPLTIIGIIIGYIWIHGYLPLNIAILGDQFPNLYFSLVQTTRLQTIASKISIFDRVFWQTVITSAGIIAVIAVLETIISAKIADRLTQTKHKQDREVLAVSLANIWSWLTGGLPTTAVLIRTALNIKSGANSWISAVIAGISVIGISRIAFPYFIMIPMPIIAAILVNIALGLLDFELYRRIYRFDRMDISILIIVAVVTFLSDPIYGVVIGVAISLLSYIKRNTQCGMMITLFRKKNFIAKMPIGDYHHIQKPEDLIIIKFSSHITFLSIASIEKAMEKIIHKPTIIVSLSNVLYIDMDGIDTLHDLISWLNKNNIKYYLASIPEYVHDQLRSKDYYDTLQLENRIYTTSSQVIQAVL